ncbi:MAG: hypothetical protein MK212_00525 [Saprospiraceae bacterium]|nr:hypothetical protein [Saprospiraceae bacterium]
MSKGIDKITELVNKTTESIEKGKAVTEKAKGTWTEITEVYTNARAIITKATQDYEKIKQDLGEGDIGSKIMAAIEAKTAIEQIINDVQETKDKVFKIYDDAKEIKDEIVEIIDTLKYIVAELKKWEQIKKEIEEQLVEAKMEIIKAVATCKKLATDKYREAKAGLDGLLNDLGTMDLSTMTESVKKTLLQKFEDVMENYDWWTSGGESQVKDLKKAIKKSVTDNLEGILNDAIKYVERSRSWQRVEGLVTAIEEMKNSLQDIFTDTGDKETLTVGIMNQVKTLSANLAESAGEQASSLLDPISKPMGKAFDLVGKFIKAYQLADGAIAAAQKFPEGLDQYLPKTYSKDFIDWKKNLFSYSLTVPIVSLGWINLTASVSLSSDVDFKLSGSITFYNTFKPEELKILDGTLTSSGSISITGSVSLGVNLVGIVEAKATAKLTGVGAIERAEAKLNVLRKLSGDAKKGAIQLKADSTLSFTLTGVIEFSVGLTSTLRTLVKWFTGKDPVATWELAKAELFKAETSQSFNTSIKFEAFEFDFKKVKELLAEISTYRLTTNARKEIQESVSDKLGKREKWEEHTHGAKLTDDDVNALRARYASVDGSAVAR